MELRGEVSHLTVLLRTWPEEYEVLINVQDDGRVAAIIYRNSKELWVGYGASPVEAVTNLEAILDA